MIPHPEAREMAQRLAARFRDDDWSVRLAAYSAGCHAIIERFGDSRRGRRLLRDYATAVVEAFGAPAIECNEQMAIWAGSSNPQHRTQAQVWLARQGGEVVIERADGARVLVQLPAEFQSKVRH